MIFILHYLLFNAGLPAIIILIALYLQTYSNATIAEIGALLMALPFVSILIKPLFCALADRKQAHKLYLMIALALMALGYGSLAIAPFFPTFTQTHGRLVWYFDILGIIVGYSAFGVVWSLGDALAVNHAQMAGVPWGAYRVWGVVAWGGGGIVIGQINELSFLPKYVPAMFVLLVALLAEISLLAMWPNKHFVMGGSLDDTQLAAGQQQQVTSAAAADEKGNSSSLSNDEWRRTSAWSRRSDFGGSASNGNTLSGCGSARADPRMIGAVANIFMEDLSGTLRSSLRRLGSSQRPAKQRAGLDEILAQHCRKAPAAGCGSSISGSLRKHALPPVEAGDGLVSGADQQEHNHSESSLANTTAQSGGANRMSSSRKSTLRRAQLALSRMNSLSAASGHVIADELSSFDLSRDNSVTQSHVGGGGATTASGRRVQRQQAMYMSSLTSLASLGKATAAARQLGSSGHNGPSQMSGSLRDSPSARVARSSVIGPRVSLADISEKQARSPTSGDENHFEMRTPSAKELEALGGAGMGQCHECTLAGIKEKPNSENSQQQQLEGSVGATELPANDLQLLLLKLIIRRDKSIWRYLIMFTIFGALLICHLSYFFLHLEQLCREKGADFSLVMGGMMAAHSVSEVLSFTIVVPYFVPLVGRSGALLTCALIYALRFAYYGTYLEMASPYTGVPFELAHGIAYGIVYSLITDIACECVNQVDVYFPELIQRGLVDPQLDPNRLKLQLRATMQGLFSGAFDGLGNGIGALAGGLFLDAYSFAHLWRMCTYVCLVTLVVYPLTEWRSMVGYKEEPMVVGLEKDHYSSEKPGKDVVEAKA